MDDLTEEEFDYLSGWAIFYPRREQLFIAVTTEETMIDMYRSLIDKGYLVANPFKTNNSPLISIYLSDKGAELCEIISNYRKVL